MFSCYSFNLSQPLLPPPWPQVYSPFLPYYQKIKNKNQNTILGWICFPLNCHSISLRPSKGKLNLWPASCLHLTIEHTRIELTQLPTCCKIHGEFSVLIWADTSAALGTEGHSLLWNTTSLAFEGTTSYWVFSSLCSLFLSLHYLSVFCLLNHIFKTRNHRGLPRWSRVKNPPSSAGDTGLIPSQGTKSSHAARQPSPYAATKTQHSHIYFFFLSKKSKL